MLLFRSEEHIDAWSAVRELPRGYILTVEQAHRLARAWYSDKLRPDWRRKTPAETAQLFASLDLRGPFWHLTL